MFAGVEKIFFLSRRCLDASVYWQAVSPASPETNKGCVLAAVTLGARAAAEAPEEKAATQAAQDGSKGVTRKLCLRMTFKRYRYE